MGCMWWDGDGGSCLAGKSASKLVPLGNYCACYPCIIGTLMEIRSEPVLRYLGRWARLFVRLFSFNMLFDPIVKRIGRNGEAYEA